MSDAENQDLESIFQTLKLVRKGSEDDYEVRSSDDGKLWGVKAFLDNPKKPTYILYAGPDAKELAAELADYELEEDDEDDDDDEGDE